MILRISTLFENAIEVTDGWYFINCFLDPSLVKVIHSMREGDIVSSFGAELISELSSIPCLEAGAIVVDQFMCCGLSVKFNNFRLLSRKGIPRSLLGSDVLSRNEMVFPVLGHISSSRMRFHPVRVGKKKKEDRILFF